MTQEEKQLLLKDLCTRLPYGVMCNHYNRTEIIANISDKGFYQPMSRDGWHNIEEIKPYLRPLSSMTDEEKNELLQLMGCGTDIKRVDFYISHHFDYRGLIEKGLALEAPEGMYDSKKA